MSLLKLNQKAVETSTRTKKRIMPTTIEREGRWDNEAILLVTAQENTFRLPKGKSQDLLSVNRGNGIIVVPNYIDAEYSYEALAEALPEEVLNLIPTYTGAEILANIENKKFYANLSDDDRLATITELAEVLNNATLYCVPSFVSKRNVQLISIEDYKAIDASIKAAAQSGDVDTVAELRAYKAKFHVKKDKISITGSITEQGQFSSNAWRELGGDNNIYGDETFTTTISKEDAINATEKFSKFTKYSIYPTPLIEGDEDFYLLHTREEFATYSKAGTKATEKAKANVQDVDIDEEELEDEL